MQASGRDGCRTAGRDGCRDKATDSGRKFLKFLRGVLNSFGEPFGVREEGNGLGLHRRGELGAECPLGLHHGRERAGDGMDAAMDAGIGKGWMSGQGDGERCRDKATVLQGNGLGLHRWRWRRERTKGWMQASGRSVTWQKVPQGSSRKSFGEPFGVFCPFGGIAVTDCIGGDGRRRQLRIAVREGMAGASRRWMDAGRSVTWAMAGERAQLHRWRWRRQLRIAASVHGMERRRRPGADEGIGGDGEGNGLGLRSWTAVLDGRWRRQRTKATNGRRQRGQGNGLGLHRGAMAKATAHRGSVTWPGAET